MRYGNSNQFPSPDSASSLAFIWLWIQILQPFHHSLQDVYSHGPPHPQGGTETGRWMAALDGCALRDACFLSCPCPCRHLSSTPSTLLVFSLPVTDPIVLSYFKPLPARVATKVDQPSLTGCSPGLKSLFSLQNCRTLRIAANPLTKSANSLARICSPAHFDLRLHPPEMSFF